MLRAQGFRVDPRRIVHETIEDETIIIDLDTGTYYSLRGSAPAVWSLLVAGHSESGVVAEMRARYPSFAQEASEATVELVSRLREEGLIEYAQPDATAADTPQAPAPTGADGEFSAPLLEKYSDMEYFLLLDPIHEVEEGGWPRASAASVPPGVAG